ncbi:MAG: hypothetical protein WKF96_01560 [Solirubrobacteraceae bacterium]
MPLPAPLNLKEWFKTSIEDYLIIGPTSVSPQPVHVLNGFFHTALSGRRSARTAIDLVATSAGNWARSADHVRERGSVNLPASDHDLLRVRRATAGLISTDRAVFSAKASFQLAHLGLVTSDTTHFRLGGLASRLALESGRAGDELGSLVERLSHPQPNPQWAVQSVLADPGVTDGWQVKAPPALDWWGVDPRCADLAAELGGVLRRAIALAAGSADSLLGLQTLGIAATWCGLIAFAQVPSLLADQAMLGLLTEAGTPGALPTVRDSSAHAFDRVQNTFYSWLADRLTPEVADRFGGRPPTTSADVHEFLRLCEPYALSGGARNSQQRLPEIYDLWAKDNDAFRAMGLALQDSLQQSMGDKPRKWFSAVGRHCGFVGPRRGYPARFRVEVALAPALVLAGMSDDDGPSVRFADWQERLAQRFGVHFGPNAVARGMVPRASEEELDVNAANLAQLLSSLGLARRYSDGVTEVLNPTYLWRMS